MRVGQCEARPDEHAASGIKVFKTPIARAVVRYGDATIRTTQGDPITRGARADFSDERKLFYEVDFKSFYEIIRKCKITYYIFENI